MLSAGALLWPHEEPCNSSAGLAMDGNDTRFAPGVSGESVFVADWSGDRLAIGQNTLAAGLTHFQKR